MFKPNYSLTNEIIHNLVQIAEQKTQIEHSKIVPKQDIILKKRAAMRMAADSTAIEGNVLNALEVQNVFEGKSTFAPAKDEIEVKNYKKGIEFINQALENKVKISHEFILHIHKILMHDLLPAEKLGKYRPGAVYVVNQGAKTPSDKLLYSAPDSKLVRKFVDELLVWTNSELKSDLHPVVIAALFHYQFVTVHPFSDGNGRTTRLLTTFLLYQNGFDLNRIYALDSYYNKNRMEYYRQLDVGKTFADREKKDLTPWILYFTNGVIWELERIIEQIMIVRIQMKDEDGPKVILDQDEIRIIDFLSTMGTITSNDVSDILKLSKRSAQLKLKRLSELNIIEIQGKGPASYFILKD